MEEKAGDNAQNKLEKRLADAKMKLKNYVTECGGRPDMVEDWKVVSSLSNERILISYDTGKRKLRSRVEAAKYLGLEPMVKQSGKRKSLGENTESQNNVKAKRPNRDAEKAPCEGEGEMGSEAKGDTGGKFVVPTKLVVWQKKKIENAPERWRKHCSELLTEGFTVVKSVLSPIQVKTLLHGEQELEGNTLLKFGQRLMRERKGNQTWLGAVRTIHDHIKRDGDTETVLCPLTTRANGRYDMPIPPEARIPIEKTLEEKGLIDFVKYICPRGKFRTHDIMLSKPGSQRQRMHTDSSWMGKARTNPAPHYLTILIPLSVQDRHTGGTRVWPRTHRVKDPNVGDDNAYIDCIEPILCVGDALLFDGLLCHLGLENTSGLDNQSAPRDRYFYYAAFASGHDPNTEVTGFSNHRS